MRKLKDGFLTGNQLKLIAMIAMTLDHIGVQIFTDSQILRIIGRLAFPVFAYMIAEGCQYTKNRKKYLFMLMGEALVCQLVYYFAMGSLYQCIFVTFSLSVALIYALDKASSGKVKYILLALFTGLVIYVIAVILPEILHETDFEIDYGLWGIMLPVLIYAVRGKGKKLLIFILGLVLLSISYGDIQWYSLFAVIPIALYNDKRGKMKLKYLFYIYYPLHLMVIYMVSIYLIR